MAARFARNTLLLFAFLIFAMDPVFSQGNGNGNGNGNGSSPPAEEEPGGGGIGGGGIQPLVGGGGGGGGGGGLEFDVSILESNLPGRYPGATAMGDGYNPVTGDVTFSVVDISIPGNSAIPVELRRWIPTNDSDTGGPTGWKWDLPMIKGKYLDMKPGHSDSGWDWGLTTWHDGDNCTGDSDSVIKPNGDKIASNMYWEGKLLHIPDVTSEKFLIDTAPNPDVQITKSNFKIDSCIDNSPSIQDGIVVAGPNGLTYTFNEIRSYWNGKDTLKDPNTMTRILLVTKIEDRFGNDVQYTYDSTSNVTQILASDGRKITIAYQTVSGKKRPTTATVDNNSPTADRVWTYTYESSGSKNLESVTLPDGSKWEYSGLHIFEFDPNDPIGVYSTEVGDPPGYVVPACGKSSTQQTASVTTPEDALIDYTFRETYHDRSDVEPAIRDNIGPDNESFARNLHCTVSLSLIEREVSGPGLDTIQWTYDYSENEGTYTAASGLNSYLTGTPDLQQPSTGFPSMINTTTDINYRSVTIAGPDKKTIIYIDRKFQTPTEGMVVAIDELAIGPTALLKRTEKIFVKGALVGNHWYKCPCGGEYPPSTAVNANQINYRINQTEQDAILYSGASSDTYTTEYANFDTYGFAIETSESNDFSSDERYTRQTYVHDTTNWLLGLPAQTQVADDSSVFTSPGSHPVASETTYHSATGSYKSLPNEQRSFGRWFKRNTSYHLSGNQKGLPLRVTYNATNRWVEFSNYKRGIAQTIKTPQSLTTTPQYAYVTIDDNGWKTQFKDFENNITNHYCPVKVA